MISLSAVVKYISSSSKTVPQEKSFPITTSCPSPRDVELTYTATTVVHKGLTTDLPAAVAGAMELQSRFLRGYLNSTYNQKIINHRILITAEKKSFKILEQTDSPYSMSITLPEGASKTHNRYVTAAFKKKNLSPRDPAQRVTYQAVLSAIECFHHSELPEITAVLPLDPHLAFWALPSSLHRPVKYFATSRVTNPCSAPTWALMSDDNLYWYFWSPEARTKDVQCPQELEARQAVTKVPLEIRVRPPEPKQEVGFEQLAAGSGVSVGIIWGFMNDRPSPVAAIEGLRDLFEGRTIGHEFLKTVLKQAKTRGLFNFDSSMPALIDLLAKTESFINNAVFTVKIGEKSAKLQVRGVLKQSRKDVTIDVYFGNTSLYKDDLYQAPLLEFLRHKDLVFYVGHSGMGDNLDFSKIETANLISASEKRYQFFGIIGCYSLAEYGHDYLKLRPSDSTTDLLLTYSEAYSYLLPNGFLNHLDKVMGGQKSSLAMELERHSLKQDILWMNRFSK